MTSPKELKPLKALLIVGPDISISNEIKALFNGRNDCLIIGDGSTEISVKNIESTLKQKNFKITRDTRIDINAHGNRTNNKQHKIKINTTHSENMSLTEQVFKGIKEIAKCPLYIHLWSCYGGSANKAASSLDNNSILVTHVESKSPASIQLSSYSRTLSLKRYLEGDLTPYQQFILDLPENFAAITFNKIWANGATKKFKFSRMLKKNKMADVFKTFSAENDLTEHFNFNDLFVKEAERFKGIFKYVNITSVVNFVSQLKQEQIQTFTIGVLIHSCIVATKQQFIHSFGQLVCALKKQGIDINRPVNGTTALHMACSEGNINVVKILLENGADINAKNVNDKTPLHL